MPRIRDSFTFPCPTCGKLLRDTSFRTLRAHERGEQHGAAVAAQGRPTWPMEYERACQAAWQTHICTPG